MAIVEAAGVAEALQKDIEDATTACERTASELQTCKEALLEAERLAEEAGSIVDEARKKRLDANKVAKAAESEHKGLQKNLASQLKAWQESRQEHAKCREVAESSLKVLAEGTWESDEEMAKNNKVIANLLVTLKVEKALAAGAPLALTLKPDSRRNFDNLLVEAVVQSINARVSSLAAAVAEESTPERLAKAELLGLWAIADTTEDDAKQAEKVEVSAVGAHKRTLSDVEFARKRLKQIDERLAVLDEARQSCAEKLRKLQEPDEAPEVVDGAPPPDADGDVGGGTLEAEPADADLDLPHDGDAEMHTNDTTPEVM